MATLKIQSAEIEPFWATPEILFFWRMRFSNFFLNYMVWKYQNEIAPIFYYGISTKTNEKDIKIPKLQPPDWKSPYWMSLYIFQFCRTRCFWARKYNISCEMHSRHFDLAFFGNLTNIKLYYNNLQKCHISLYGESNK